jgi:hypothetical protein
MVEQQKPHGKRLRHTCLDNYDDNKSVKMWNYSGQDFCSDSDKSSDFTNS